ncbi:ABC transporter ATP-binding protein [Phyllobacterium zundukense]|uniref:Spermidine/putrescine import ATP-binding protein PotA n=1 Tax=Phyllobacterium zundukense TaxID=1867719 RepID=A0A2N9W314_9HYPH|nr:ABC transporter ATP-binding protein [Phyllobacterium zundukense]ATU94289.1 Fe3+/spermidine/putrescine ABC transporter ATP-binding protein [Phyllobacterium zundukense]PIO46132.1 Fe3+/spermidine/putrescine ABC transporter ATP-binding protein [Phyllobacterium zundukense]
MSNPFIRLEEVSKSFGLLTVVEGLNLEIGKGEFISLLGPSGSGKTTILMMLAGFESPTSGAIWAGGKRIDSLPPHKRNMGVVFQNYALFPHMTVFENVGFPLRMRGISRADITERVRKALEMVQLGSLADRRPSQLSGGQQQRVALARALIFEPEVVLMDEPLGALDKQLREQMQLDIRDLHRRLDLTIVFVTHDQSEALTMSDRIAIFNRGKIEQIGKPSDIYDHPSTQFVAEFIGETNLISGPIQNIDGGTARVQLPGGQEVVVETAADFRQDGNICLSIRPERIRVKRESGTGNNITATVSDVVYHGDHLRLMLRSNGQPFVVKTDRSQPPPSIGEEVHLSFLPADCWVVRT